MLVVWLDVLREVVGATVCRWPGDIGKYKGCVTEKSGGEWQEALEKIREERLRLLGHPEEVTRRCRNENIEDGSETEIVRTSRGSHKKMSQ